MNEPQSNEGAELLPDRPTATSPELTLLPDRGDFVGEAVPLPDREDAVYEMVPLPNPARPSEPATDGIEPPPEEPPIERHDPFAWMRNAPWMNRRLSPSGRAAILLRRDLDAFPVIEGRDPNHADLDAIVKRTVDYIVPIIRREQATDFIYEELERRREERIAKARAASLALPAAGEVAGTLPVVGAAIARLAPVAAGVAGAAVGGFATLVVPTNFEGETFPLGDGLRARRRVGQRSIEIERQVDNGLLGSGVAATWEKLPVAAQFLPDAAGRDLLQIDSVQLERAVGKEAADRLLQQGGVAADGLTGVAKDIHDAIVRRRLDGVPAGPGGVEPPPGFLPIMEMRITSSVDGGTTVSHAEIEDEKVSKLCPNYAKVQKIGLEAGTKADAMGLPKGPTRGQWIHGEAESALRTAEIKKLLLDSGIQELHVEQAFLGKRDIRFLESGASKIDVLEKLDDNTVCIYDYKTGGARFPDPTREKYLRAAVARFGVTTVYVMPVYVP
jgi:hypothetical protein